MLVIQEHVIDEVLLLMSISMPTEIKYWHEIVWPIFFKVTLMKLEQERASWYVYDVPKPFSRKQAIFTASKCQYFTKGRTNFLKANGAEDKPKG